MKSVSAAFPASARVGAWLWAGAIAFTAGVLIVIAGAGLLITATVALALVASSQRMAYLSAAIAGLYALVLPWVASWLTPLGLSAANLLILALTALALVLLLSGGLMDARTLAALDRRRVLHTAHLGLVLPAAALVLAATLLFRSFPLVSHASGAVLVALVWARLPRGFSAVKGRTGALLANLGMVAAASLIGLGVVEFGARTLLYPEGLPGTIYMHHPEQFFTLRPNADGATAFQLTETDVRWIDLHSSSQGLRDIEHPPKRPDETRIALLGDSFTFGVTVELEHTIARQLAGLLEDAPATGPTSVMNVGLGGTAPWQQAIMLKERGFPLEPDIVIHQLFLGNDIAGTLERTGQHLASYNMEWEQTLNRWRRYRVPQFRLDQRLRTTSAAYAALREALPEEPTQEFLARGLRIFPEYRFRSLAASAPRVYRMEPDLRAWYTVLEEGWAGLLEDIEEIAETCRERNVRYAVYTIPYKQELWDERWKLLTVDLADDDYYERGKARRMLAKALGARGIPHFDAAPELAEHGDLDAVYYEHDGHLTPLGNGIVAEEIRDFLMQQGWVTDADDTARGDGSWTQTSSSRTAVP